MAEWQMQTGKKLTHHTVDRFNIIITSPCLNAEKNVSGISAMASFIIRNNAIHNYTHFELGKWDSEKRDLKWFRRIMIKNIRWIKYMIKEKDVLVHFNFALETRSILRDFPFILIARLFNKRMVIHLHGGKYLGTDKIPFFIRIILKKVMSGNEPKIVLGSGEKDFIVRNYAAKNIFILPNCIDLEDAKAYEKHFFKEKQVGILFMGRIIKNKGLDSIAAAIKILKEKNLPVKFFLAGTGPDEDGFKSRISELLGSDFIHAGVVSGEVKSGLFKKCDIFLLPSLYGEGLPVSLLESMSFGLIPVVTGNGSMKDVVKSGVNGFVVKSNSPEEIAAAVETLINDGTLKEKLSTNARNYVFSSHDPEIFLSELNKIYDNIA